MLTDQQKEYLKQAVNAELARRLFYEFCVFMDPSFFSPSRPHLKQIAEAFQGITDGYIKRLAISMPPRAGKSYITSLWCAWMLGKYNEGSIMRNSYAAELANSFSYDIRQIVQKERYLLLFPEVKLRSDRRAVEDWALETSTRSAYFAAGVGGPITGKGCNLAGILDDPIKNIEDALSETIIGKTWQWYTSTHLSRFETGCPEIHIATRWSMRDPIGMLTNPFSEAYDSSFTIIKIPALDSAGKSFCEAVKTTQEYHELRRITDEFIWEAEFLQNPVESKGLLYPAEELKRFALADLATKVPDGILGFTDTADRGEDHLCAIIGRRYGPYTYVTDVLFSQDGVEITEPLTAQLIIDSKCENMKVEANNGGSSFCRNVRTILRQKGNTCYMIDEPSVTNKETRILMGAGYVKEFFYFRDDYAPGSDYDKFIRALTSYIKLGTNKHDDAPDAITGLADYSKSKHYAKPGEHITGVWARGELRMKGYKNYQINRMVRLGHIKLIGR